MAWASHATARMSSTDGLFAMRYSGSSRASACFAGSSEGNGLSVMAIMVVGIQYSGYASLPDQVRRWLESKHLRIDAIRQFPPFKEGKNIVDDNFCHLLAHFRRGAAEMRGKHDIRHRLETLVDFRLVLKDVKPGAGDLFGLERAHQRRLVDDGAAGGVDQKRGFFHQPQLAGADLMAGLRVERRMQRDEIGFAQ